MLFTYSSEQLHRAQGHTASQPAMPDVVVPWGREALVISSLHIFLPGLNDTSFATLTSSLFLSSSTSS